MNPLMALLHYFHYHWDYFYYYHTTTNTIFWIRTVCIAVMLCTNIQMIHIKMIDIGIDIDIGCCCYSWIVGSGSVRDGNGI